jgi:hypothetical protein
MKIQMTKLMKTGIFLGALSLLATGSAYAQEKVSIDGKWYRFSGLESPEVDVEDREIEPAAPVPEAPLKSEYLDAYRAERARLQAAEDAGTPISSGFTRCTPSGMPGMMLGIFPMEVLESPGQVTVIQEAYSEIRRIYLDGEELPTYDDAEPRFWGHSAGNWNGDTLEVETIGIKEYVEFRNVPHSNQMRIHERIRLLNDNVMINEVSVTDPVYLDEPWEWTWMYSRDTGYKLYEYVCEDNREYTDPETGEARLRMFGAGE